jgi:hypothetical protein
MSSRIQSHSTGKGLEKQSIDLIKAIIENFDKIYNLSNEELIKNKFALHFLIKSGLFLDKYCNNNTGMCTTDLINELKKFNTLCDQDKFQTYCENDKKANKNGLVLPMPHKAVEIKNFLLQPPDSSKYCLLLEIKDFKNEEVSIEKAKSDIKDKLNNCKKNIIIVETLDDGSCFYDAMIKSINSHPYKEKILEKVDKSFKDINDFITNTQLFKKNLSEYIKNNIKNNIKDYSNLYKSKDFFIENIKKPDEEQKIYIKEVNNLKSDKLINFETSNKHVLITIDDFYKKISETGCYAEQSVLNFVSLTLNVIIVLINSENTYRNTIFPNYINTNSNDLPIVYIWYNGTNHYKGVEINST